ncbi:MAG: flavodoxin family protein [Oscillospiraceae bacterium]|jgi:multimeric flavodoxin WrbA|nr:flavodoxin family protein [Oscillospiraceae bacterium]
MSNEILNTVLFSSPRTDGFTANVLKKFFPRLDDFNFINCFNMKISPCIDCRFCKEHKKCAFDDDMSKIYQLLENSKFLIVASPIYCLSFPVPLKAILERTQVYYYHKNTKEYKKFAFLITSSGSSDELGAFVAENQIRSLCGVTGFEFMGSMSFFGTDSKTIVSGSD